MAKKPMIGATGKPMFGAGGKPLLEDGDCCCADCCIEEGGPPTADFSYEQTSSDPCTFAFTDESVAGTCGEIVEWYWDFGDSTTSTSQNPTHAYSGDFPSGPWDVTLTVTDEAGCEDSAVMEVECLEFHSTCSECIDAVPDAASVTFTGFVDNDCTDCEVMNTTYSMGNVTVGANGCSWASIDITLPQPCDVFNPHFPTVHISLAHLGGGLRVEASITVRERSGGSYGTRTLFYRKFLTDVCRGTHVLDYYAQGIGFGGVLGCTRVDSTCTVVL